jgi:hypothetical protein
MVNRYAYSIPDPTAEILELRAKMLAEETLVQNKDNKSTR